ncbi:hypothetical protein pb186bvf_004546 [Paramecium bursaria]
MKYLVLVLLLFAVIQAQKPCAEYSYNESECIGSKGNQCIWNEIYNSCEESSSDQIGCNYNLNEMACLSQILYPDQSFAYCRFSGYCRQLIGEIAGCSKDFSVPACYAVSNQDCMFSDYCQISSSARLTNLTNYLNYDQTILSHVDVFVCQNIRIYPVIHSYGKQELIEGLIESYRQINVSLARKYRQMQTFLGCFQPDDLILNQLLCSDSGVNIKACTIITTTGQLCQFINGKCNNVLDSSILNCQDNLNIWACLSVSKISQPCYWDDVQKNCLRYQITSQTQCDTFKINGVIYKNSPSFCSANIYQTISNSKVTLYECFFDPHKYRCNQMCRGIVLTDQNCKKSVYGFSYRNSTCIFKNRISQCTLPGQNKYSCMNANEPCQFLNGFCKPLASTDTTNLQCQQGLNKFACINVSNLSQTCQFNLECNYIGLDAIDEFDEQVDPTQPIIQPINMNVNPNVCRKLIKAIRYYESGNCFHSVNPACTSSGLNKMGCLTTTYNINPCIWNPMRGVCQDLVVNSTTQCQDLLQVNPYACKKVTAFGQLCGYQSPNCINIILNDALTCDYPGLNRFACISIQKFACRFQQNQCKQIITEITQGVMCNGLESVTLLTCLLILTGGETCYYDSQNFRCSADVTPLMGMQYGLNKYGCSILNADCYYNKGCLSTLQSDLNSINCTTNFPTRTVCIKITTVGVQCQWNTHKSICNPPKYPTNQYCIDMIDVNENACLGFTTLEQVDPAYHYCYKDPTTSNACKLFPGIIPLQGCTLSEKVNIYPCVAIAGTNLCYFDQANLSCSSLLDTTSAAKFKNTQQNYFLITTPGQKCIWSTDQKICEFQDPQTICDTVASQVNPNYCETINDSTECHYENQKCSKTLISPIGTCEGLNLKGCINSALGTGACYYDQRLRDCQTVTLPNTLDCSQQLNKFGCQMAQGGPSNLKGCKWVPPVGSVSGKCQVSDEKDFTQSCDKYEGIIACASAIESCEFNLNTFICETANGSFNQNPQCQIGRNQLVCNQQLCNFTTGSNLCISSICLQQTDQESCMSISTEPCTYNQQLGCLGSILLPTTQCSNYQDPDKLYNQQTCLSIENCYLDIISNKCTSTSPSICLTSIKSDAECRNIQNDCLWNKVNCYQRPNTSVVKVCLDYFTKYGCTTTKLLFYTSIQSLVGCYWDDAEMNCKEFIDPYNCEMGLFVSQSQCYKTIDSMISCYYDKNSRDCQTFTFSATACVESKNQFECASIADNCWWDPDNLICSLFSLISPPASKTYLCLAYNIEGEMCQFAGSCVYSDPLNSKCTDQLNKIACAGVAVLGETCAFATQCGVADLNIALCTDSVNIYGCIGIVTDKQYCIWLGRQCAPFTNDGITQDSQSLINASVCTRAYTINGLPVPKLPAIGVKYSSDTFGCQPSDPSVDTCTTPGMNYYACLNSQIGSCTWDKINKKCTNFVDPGTYTTCEQYLNVSSKVCQQITKPGLKCQSTQDGCSTMTSQSQCSYDLNKLACLTQKLQPCQWLNNTCVLQNVTFGVVSCVPTIAGQPYLNPLSSPLSCSYVNYNSQICYYDPIKQGCITQFDPLVFTCNTKGLNLDGCILIKNQSCQFQNGYCLKLDELGPTDCNMLRNVSQLTCAQLVNGSQTCKASVFQGICLSVGLTDLCSTTGINQSGCGYLPQCLWNPDSSKCLCAQFNQGLVFCNGISQETCANNQSCIWKSHQCLRQTCEDLVSCTDMVDGQTCYQSLDFYCKSAKTCYDIQNVNDCTKYTINGVKCQLYMNGYCQPSQCIHITQEIYCNGNCKWDGIQCYYQQCQFLQKQQCYGTYLNLGCGWYQDICHGYQYCEQISNLPGPKEDLQQLCNLLFVKEVKCLWQLTLSGKSYECSSNQCRLFKKNKMLCHGREVGNEFLSQVCVHDNVQGCVSCEMIKDDCQCAQYVGHCIFQFGKCYSILCNSFQTIDSCGININIQVKYLKNAFGTPLQTNVQWHARSIANQNAMKYLIAPLCVTIMKQLHNVQMDKKN